MGPQFSASPHNAVSSLRCSSGSNLESDGSMINNAVFLMAVGIGISCECTSWDHPQCDTFKILILLLR